MSREIKLLPNITAPKNYQVPYETQRAEAQLKPEQYADQMRVLLRALDETNAALRTFGFRADVKIAWGSGNDYRDASTATIQKTVKL